MERRLVGTGDEVDLTLRAAIRASGGAGQRVVAELGPAAVELALAGRGLRAVAPPPSRKHRRHPRRSAAAAGHLILAATSGEEQESRGVADGKRGKKKKPNHYHVTSGR